MIKLSLLPRRKTWIVLISECLVCHSNKEAQRGPVIHGMERWYLIDQLEKFKSGVRGQRPSNRSEYLMGVGARKIENDYQLAFLANWFAEQNPLPAIRTVQGNIEEEKNFIFNDVHPATEKMDKAIDLSMHHPCNA